MRLRRRISYAVTRDGFHIAYAVLGDGELCHVFLAEATSCVDEVQALHPAHIRFERLAGALSRLVFLDPRGIGTSDTVPPEQTLQLESWTTDLLAVLDDMQVERAVVSGEGYAGHAATRFAVTHPERTLRMALTNSFPRMTVAEDYAIGPYSLDQIDELAAWFERVWGTGEVMRKFVPSLLTDPSFLDYFAARERRTMGPRTAAAVLRTMASSDIRDLLPRVSVPTLVYHTGDLLYSTLEHSRYLAEHIPGAILVEASGDSFYFPNDADRLSAWAEFIVGGPAALSHETKVLTVLFTDVVGSTERASTVGDAQWASILADLDTYVADRVERYGGRLVKQTGDGHLAAFETPGQAVRVAFEIARGVHVLGVELRCGLHAGEVEVRPGGDVGGIAVHTAARIRDAAGPRQVLVSRTVADLAAGSQFRFEDRGTQDLRGVPGPWQLFEVVD